MDSLRVFLHMMLTLMTGRNVYSATSDFTLTSWNCKSNIYVKTYGTTISWDGSSIRSCKININKDDYSDSQICVKMINNDMKDFDNTVKFKTSYDSSLTTFNKYSGTYETCTYNSDPYINVETESTPGGSFDLNVYTKSGSSDVNDFVQSTVMTIGAIIGVIIGVIVLLVIVIIIIVCCCCMKGRRTQGHVYRQQGQTTTVTTHQMMPPGQPQATYPQQPPAAGYPAAQPAQYGGYPPQQGYTAQPAPGAPPPPVYNQYQGYPPPQTQPSAPSAPPPDNVGYMEKPPPYST